MTEMNITKFEKDHGLAPGELTKAISKEFPKFTKVQMSMVRHPENGVVLSPKIIKFIKEKYDTPKEKKPSTTISVKFPQDIYDKIIKSAAIEGMTPAKYVQFTMDLFFKTLGK